MKRTHGGHPDPRVLDFSASVSPLGPPASVIDALRDLVGLVARYPEPDAGALCRAAAAHHRVPPEAILAGNGAAELIYLVASTLRGVPTYLCEPGFGEYRAACEASGARIVSSPDQARAVFVANPTNPHGALCRAETLLSLCGIRVVDEAFMSFTDETESLASLAAERPDLIVLRSLTKAYALPGLRVGYLVAHPATVRRLAKLQPPWQVNALAIAAGVAALRDEDYLARLRAELPVLRDALLRGVRERGIDAADSAANYVLCRVASAQQLTAGLLAHGIAVRDCSSFRGLTPDRHVRIAVRSEAENARLIRALRHLYP